MQFLDTNILVYASCSLSPFHGPAKELRNKANNGEIDVCISPQVLAEFYAIISDPKRTKPVFTPAEAYRLLKQYEMSTNIRKVGIQSSAIYLLLELIEKYNVTRQKVFDALIVATMLENGIKEIYTNNSQDFEIYKDEIVIINPF